jgi:RecB family exonuclease
MIRTDFLEPNPVPIQEVSPSLANQLLGCRLRAGFARDPTLTHWRRPTTYSALGLVAHTVSEAVFGHGHWPSDANAVRDKLQDLWNEETERQAARLAAAWHPAIPPPADQWPGYALTRARTIRRGERILDAQRRPVQSVHAPSGSQGSGIEVSLRDTDTGLFGRADRIERDGSSVRVVDLKTGLNQGEPTDEQRRQLLLYALLVQRTTGTWPATVAIEDAAGLQQVAALEPAEAEAALAEVRTAVNQFNQDVAAGDLVTSAAPGPDRCRWCSFRAICWPYWEAVSSSWGHRASCGNVLDAGATAGQTFLVLDIEGPSDRKGTRLHVSGLAGDPPSEATKAVVIDWTGETASGSVQARWSTILRSW